MGIESALVGLGVGAKTAGIISSGLSIFSGISSIAGGAQSQSEGNYQSELAMQQAQARGVEQERVAQREARLTQEEALDTERRQKLAYMASGVTLEGSPLLVMEETRKKGQDNVNEILQSGRAASSASIAEGRIEATQLKSAGRQAFTSGITGALKGLA
jgi:hypothetical protein